jgi:LCP family protein required for cell wall assembly
MVLGCLIAFLAAAGTGAVFVLEQVKNITDALNQNKSLQVGNQLASAGYGSAQTLLLVGDDTRKVFKYYKGFVPDLANEMLLVRLDPSKPYISMMSIPRELQVTIHPPGGGAYTNRINSAFTFGIPTLVSTIKQVTGLAINHVVVITFTRFEQAVNDIGCVYSTVDRRYYHVNTPGSEQYQQINLQPGYQKMCGSAAEQFVSYRHTDTSLVRDSRDQSFLLDAKKQYGPTLVDNIGKFERIFGRTVQTDPSLHSTTGILDLLGTLISASSLRVRQVQFQVTLLPSFDTASPLQIKSSVHAFLFGTSPPPKHTTAALAHKLHKKHSGLPLIASPTPAAARRVATRIGFPVEYPRVMDAAGNSVPPAFRAYQIHLPSGATAPIYVAVFAAPGLGQYYDVQGTTWGNAPQFASPDQAVHVAGRTYYLYYSGQHLRMVAWYEHGAVYWVRNTLSVALGNAELLTIAEQTKSLPGSVDHAPASLRAGGPPSLVKSTAISLRQTLGAVGGLLALIAVPLFGYGLIRRRRQLALVRARLHEQTVRENRLRMAFARRGIPVPTAGVAPPPSRSRWRWRRS